MEDEKSVVESSEDEPKIVYIRAIFSANIEYAGQVTGKLYVWPLSGSLDRITPVDSRDVPFLLSKRIGRSSCCGGVGNGNKLFEIVI